MNAADLTNFAKKHPVGVVCVLLAILSGAALYFRADAVSVSQAEYEAKSAEAAKMINNVKAAPGLEEQLAELQELGKELDSRLISANQIAVNLQYFYKLESDNAVKFVGDVRQTTPPRPTRGAAAKTLFGRVPFSLTVEGNYTQLTKFLGDLQNGRHLCRINSAVFNKGNTAGGTGSADQTMTLALNLELLAQQ